MLKCNYVCKSVCVCVWVNGVCKSVCVWVNGVCISVCVCEKGVCEKVCVLVCGVSVLKKSKLRSWRKEMWEREREREREKENKTKEWNVNLPVLGKFETLFFVPQNVSYKLMLFTAL